MATFKIKIVLNKGRRGVPLQKLIKVGEELEKYLRMLGEDIGASYESNNWLAVGFDESHSVSFDAENATFSSQKDALTYKDAFVIISDYKPGIESIPTGFRSATIKQFASIGKHIEPDETIEFGIYGNGKVAKDGWRLLSQQKAYEIIEHVDETIKAYGSIQGKIHSITKGETPLVLKIRELSSGNLIRCEFAHKIYSQVIEALEDIDQIVHIGGWITYSRIDRKIEVVKADKLELAEEYLEGDLDKFFGCAPGLTGELTTDEFINRIRARGRKSS